METNELTKQIRTDRRRARAVAEWMEANKRSPREVESIIEAEGWVIEFKEAYEFEWDDEDIDAVTLEFYGRHC